MIFTFLLAFVGLTLSGVAIYYSVIGLTAIFAAAFWPIVIMGTTLEVSKLVAASWLKAKWDTIPRFMKAYMTAAVFVLMFITSMGIFGFLSKAHIEQTSMSTEQVAQIETLDDKINRSQAKIERWSTDLGRLNRGEDVRVDNLIANEQEGLDKIYARIKQEKDGLRADAKIKVDQQQLRITQAQERRDKAIAAAEEKFKGSFGGSSQYEDAVKKAKDQELGVASAAQKEILKVNTALDNDLDAVDAKYKTEIAAIQKRIQSLRDQANDKTQDIEGKITELEGYIETEQKKIDDAREEKFVYEKEYRKLEAEVGPIKYIAEFIYGEQADQTILEKAVTWVIITIIFVFDPLAVLMLLASQMTYAWYKEQQIPQQEQEHEEVESNEEPAQSEEQNTEESENISVEETIIFPEPEPFDPEEFKVEEPKYEADDGPITEEQIAQLEEDSKKKAIESSEELRKTEYEEKEQNVHWQEAKKLWKEEHPAATLKEYKKLFIEGEIDHLPWEEYVTSEAEIEKHTYIMKEKEHQVLKETKSESTLQTKEEGYIQNAEQTNSTIWKRINDGQ